MKKIPVLFDVKKWSLFLILALSASALLEKPGYGQNINSINCMYKHVNFNSSCSSASSRVLLLASSLDTTTQEMLDAHNLYRKALNIPPLVWSSSIASGSKAWVDHLIALGGRTLVHDSRLTNQGENISMATASVLSAKSMVDQWGSEKRFFRRGIFPSVSTTGNWFHVGHYTQMIWKNTTYLGCAKGRAGENDILVCRYSPRGNIVGQPVY